MFVLGLNGVGTIITDYTPGEPLDLSAFNLRSMSDISYEQFGPKTLIRRTDDEAIIVVLEDYNFAESGKPHIVLEE